MARVVGSVLAGVLVLVLCFALAMAGNGSDPRESGPEVTTSVAPTVHDTTHDALDPIGTYSRP